jgi:hypothetical protein
VSALRQLSATPAGDPLPGEVLANIELVVKLTVADTALCGSETLSERAFRLLRWPGTGQSHQCPMTRETARGGAPSGASGGDQVAV